MFLETPDLKPKAGMGGNHTLSLYTNVEEFETKNYKKWNFESYSLEMVCPEVHLVLFPIALYQGRNQYDWFFKDEYHVKKLFPKQKRILEYRDKLQKFSPEIPIPKEIFELCGLFGKVSEEIEQKIHDFIIYESRCLYRDPLKPKGGTFTPAEIVAMLLFGYNELLNKYLSIRNLFEILKNNGETVEKNKLYFSKIGRYLLNGRPDQHWYRDNLEDLHDLMPFQKLMEVNPKATVNAFVNILAATSMNSEIRTNVLLAVRVFRVWCDGEKKYEFHDKKRNEIIPTRYNRLMPMMIQQLEIFEATGDLGGRKIRNFKNAMLGDFAAIVCDIWIMRAFNIDMQYRFKDTDRKKSRGAPPMVYDSIERYLQAFGKFAELEPREACAMIWAGVRQGANGRRGYTRYRPYLAAHVHRIYGKDLFGDGVKIKQVL